MKLELMFQYLFFLIIFRTSLLFFLNKPSAEIRNIISVSYLNYAVFL
jgi:hypothetical protein